MLTWLECVDEIWDCVGLEWLGRWEGVSGEVELKVDTVDVDIDGGLWGNWDF